MLDMLTQQPQLLHNMRKWIHKRGCLSKPVFPSKLSH